MVLVLIGLVLSPVNVIGLMQGPVYAVRSGSRTGLTHYWHLEPKAQGLFLTQSSSFTINQIS